MEPLFENRYYGSYKMLEEFFRKNVFGSSSVMLIVAGVMIPVLTLYSMVLGVFGKILPMCLLMLLVCVVFALMPNLYAWSIVRNGKKQNGGTLPETVVTFGDAIVSNEGMVQITVEYHKIRSVIRLKNSYALMIGKNNGVLLDPNGFTKGSFAEFKKFLREKCPDVNIPE